MKKLIFAAVTLAAAFLISGRARADGLDYFEAQLKPFYDKPSFVAAGPEFDAKACMAGKSIFSIPVSSANPFTANIEKAMAAAAAKVGFKFTDLGEPGPKLAVGAGHERRHEREGKPDRSAGRNRPTGAGAAGSRGEGGWSSRRAVPLQRQGAILHRSQRCRCRHPDRLLQGRGDARGLGSRPDKGRHECSGADLHWRRCPPTA